MFFPPAERQNEIHFHVAPALPYRSRLWLALALMAAGFGLELLLLDRAFWLGLPAVFAGVLLMLSKGYENKVESARAGDWRPATRKELEQIVEINRRQRQWDSDAIDITCPRGFAALLGVAVTVGLTALVLDNLSHGLGRMVLWNAGVLFLPFWVTGVRFILKNDNLIVKTQMLLDLDTHMAAGRREGEQFRFQMQTAPAKKGEGEVPSDVKGVITVDGAPPAFLGVQVQVNINSVQGKSYPYAYCVIVGRPQLEGWGRKDILQAPARITVERKVDGDVCIAVIRQQTTKTSGYYTDLRTVERILDYTLGELRKILG